MDRKEFLKQGILGSFIFVSSGTAATVVKNNIDELKELEPIGFNHIKNTNSKIMSNSVLHKAETRGDANHGWLHSKHTFSFANYYNPERMHFGALRVLNDDIVAGARGFSTHPHDNMEIISIPLEGDLEHKDSMGNLAIIKEGDIQILSAGTGITHSEYNKNKDKEVKFLQIWIFPNKRNITPRYDQISLKNIAIENDFYQILSPHETDQGVTIQQDVWFHLGTFDKTLEKTYTIKKQGNGLYVFVLDGEAEVNGQKLSKKDGFGIWDVETIDIKPFSKSKLLLMEVPMSV